MPADRRAELTARWMRFAEEDLTSARAGLASRSAFQPRHVCFDAQQATEKAIKALLVLAQITFPFTHNLRDLVQCLPEDQRPPLPEDDAAELSGWAARSRYPGDDEAEWPDAERAVKIAAAVVADVRGKLRGA